MSGVEFLRCARVGIRALGLSALVCCTPIHAEQIPERGSTDSRVRTVVFDPEQVYRVQGFAGYALHVQLGSGEVYVGMGAGDMEAVSVVAQGSHVFIKPKAAHVATNLTLLTSRHTYQFDYTVSPRRRTDDDLMYSLTFVYPREAAEESVQALEAQRVTAALAVAPPILNRQYSFCGSKSLRPVEVFDDGIQTTLRFPARVDLPAVFVRSDDGAESLVNFTVSGDGLVIHRVARAFVLRRGRLVACLSNDAFAGGGQSLSTGTLSPSVERVSAGALP